jgi:hypothetical protein
MPITYKPLELTIQTEDTIHCDICGISCKHLIFDDTYNFNYAKVIPNFGYGSPLDGCEDTKVLCNACFTKLFIKE